MEVAAEVALHLAKAESRCPSHHWLHCYSDYVTVPRGQKRCAPKKPCLREEGVLEVGYLLKQFIQQQHSCSLFL